MSFRENNLDFPSDSDAESANSDSSLDLETNNIFNPIIREPILFENNIIQQIIMNNQQGGAAAVAVPVLKSEYINMVPEFHGEPELLPRFLEISEKLVNKFYNAVDLNDFQNEYLMSSLLAKIKGEAALNISSCVINTWDSLKTALLTAYSDKRDIYTLNIEMVDLKQNNQESPFDFFNKIQQKLNLQISFIASHIAANEAPIIAQYCRNLALRILLRGLREPIGSLMRTKNPADLNAALHMLTNDFQLESVVPNYFKANNYRPRPPLPRPTFQQRSIQNNPQRFMYPQQQLQITNFPQNPQPRLNFPRPNIPVPRPNNTNVFKPNPNRTFPRPTPMTVSTRNTYRPQQNSFGQRPNNTYYTNQNYYRQNQPQNNVQNYNIEEMFNIESQPTVEYPNENAPNGANILINQDFQENASESPTSS